LLAPPGVGEAQLSIALAEACICAKLGGSLVAARDTLTNFGRACVPVAVDDHSRIAFSAILPDETAASAAAFLGQALAYFARLGIDFRALLTDNGSACRSRAFAAGWRRHQLAKCS
jgi:hypothetical protein